MTYQKCPVCDGVGLLSRDGIREQCPCCKGLMVIEVPPDGDVEEAIEFLKESE